MSLENLLYTLAGMAVGFAIGFALQVRWVKRDDGHDAVRIGLSSRWQRMFFFAVGVMAVFSVALASVRNEHDSEQTQQLAAITREQTQQVARQTFCNRELIRVINDNAAVTTSDRANFDEWMSTLSGLVLNPNPDRAAATATLQAAFRKYEDTKAANAAARQPYPPPDCGE